MVHWTPRDLNLYPTFGKKNMKSINVEYQTWVRYWAQRNHFQDYKIYVTMIYMFDEDFLNNLLQLLGENLWLAHPTNQNYKTWLKKQSYYLLEFLFSNKYYLEIVINKKWPNNQSDLKENEYESPTLTYCRETNTMVPLVRASL